MSNYKWNYSTIGGVTRVNIECGDDIAHLGELDQKQWTALSCPVKGLELDEQTLAMVDADGDGRIHVNDVITTVNWLKNALGNLDCLLKKSDTVSFSDFNKDTEEGRGLLASAGQILSNLGLDKDTISVADTSDSIAIFAKTRFNGDGVITAESTDDESLKDIIAKTVAAVGSVQDRSGVEGINAELTEKFYAELAAYTAWVEAGQADKSGVFPFGDGTAEAWAACAALKDKVADFFMRCKLADFHNESTGVLDVSVERIGAISGSDLSSGNEEIASYPLARISKDCLLPLNGGINPAWDGAFSTLKSLVLDSEFASKDAITESEWLSVIARFDAFNAWTAAKAGASVESLGYDATKQLLADDRKADLLKLIEQDAALKSESESIDAVNKLTHLHRDFYSLLCNFVTMKDFYTPGELAIFQAGTLYIDQRSCDLCIRVADMGKQDAMAALSNMFIAYCDCVSRHSTETMTIAAVITGGDVNNIRVGKNAIFYDRQGNDWDATVIKVVDSPISVGQAFWRPYRKLGQFIEDTVSKVAADKDAKSMDNLTSSVSAGVEGGEKKPPFDIGKFAGIFAAIGLAFAGILAALATIAGKLSEFSFLQWVILIAVIMLVISGPAMILAWLKLRKRNLSPLLNANGWAVNAKNLVNVRFGATLTSLARMPKFTSSSDPYVMSPWKKWLLRIFAILVIAFCALYFTNSLKNWGLPYEPKPKDKPAAQTEQVDQAASETPAA